MSAALAELERGGETRGGAYRAELDGEAAERAAAERRDALGAVEAARAKRNARALERWGSLSALVLLLVALIQGAAPDSTPAIVATVAILALGVGLALAWWWHRR